MSANIAHFTARSEPAWWDKDGTYTFDEGRVLSVTEAMQEAGMDYEFLKVPNFIEIDGERVPTGYYTIVRPPVEGFIGEQIRSDEDPEDDGSGLHIFQSNVSEGFEMIQNMELAAILDPIAEEWPVETVGALRHGERTFVLLYAGEHEVKGHDLLQKYFLVADDKTGGLNITIQPTDIRVQCWNTLTAAVNTGDTKIKLPHTAGAKDNLSLAMNVMKRAREQKEEVLEMYDLFAETKVSEEDAERVIKAAYPDPNLSSNARIGQMLNELGYDASEFEGITDQMLEKAEKAYERFQYWTERRKVQRTECLDRLVAFNDENPQTANTVWAAYNAVTDYADWRHTGNLSTHSVLLGRRAGEKQKAFDACADLVMN